MPSMHYIMTLYMTRFANTQKYLSDLPIVLYKIYKSICVLQRVNISSCWPLLDQDQHYTSLVKLYLSLDMSIPKLFHRQRNFESISYFTLDLQMVIF